MKLARKFIRDPSFDWSASWAPYYSHSTLGSAARRGSSITIVPPLIGPFPALGSEAPVSSRLRYAP
jgi:hypothetical protein